MNKFIYEIIVQLSNIIFLTLCRSRAVSSSSWSSANINIWRSRTPFVHIYMATNTLVMISNSLTLTSCKGYINTNKFVIHFDSYYIESSYIMTRIHDYIFMSDWIIGNVLTKYSYIDHTNNSICILVCYLWQPKKILGSVKEDQDVLFVWLPLERLQTGLANISL